MEHSQGSYENSCQFSSEMPYEFTFLTISTSTTKVQATTLPPVICSGSSELIPLESFILASLLCSSHYGQNANLIMSTSFSNSLISLGSYSIWEKDQNYYLGLGGSA